ncbi:2-dehydropantoate 2-reductase N-terminal domain-containing protein [Pantoea rwandensis]|uniref:Mannitol-1-phosphate 5-dehydrogenase n=1 Tax=Pantoea rwandensis TaxID=1076550 RepID=A0A1X1D3U5_9GAMM|nr:2-dehydropantoate 2-reductase N-terminal domain-containing protein [Pantoea rwandensis]ORM71201.1 hypothetical protein HA51_04820 [Pantoea rwandensis]
MTNRLSAVVIGAGQSGRGFVSRFFFKSGYHLTFIDKNEKTVKYLQEDNFFTVHCFDESVKPLHIQGFDAHLARSAEADAAIEKADILLISVGQQNLPTVAAEIAPALRRRSATGLDAMTILVCENGVSPGQIFSEALAAKAGGTSDFKVAELAIFCTTNVLKKTRLDIGTENYNRAPYNAAALGGALAVEGLDPESDMSSLLKRKIYTYNFISAIVTYVGAYKGIEDYATSANDAEVRALIQRVVPELNKALCQVLGVDAESQTNFSNNALKKFSDHTIEDYVSKNAREVSRKLRSDDRMIAPANMIKDIHGDTDTIAIVIAAAILWGEKNEKLLDTYSSPSEVLTKLSGVDSDAELITQVENHYRELKSGKTISQLLK